MKDTDGAVVSKGILGSPLIIVAPSSRREVAACQLIVCYLRNFAPIIKHDIVKYSTLIESPLNVSKPGVSQKINMDNLPLLHRFQLYQIFCPHPLPL